jgi:hypothetical protein
MGKEEYVNFDEIEKEKLPDMDIQKVHLFVDGLTVGWPNLGNGLRFIGNPGEYHSMRIHKDDVDKFAKRLRQYYKDVEEMSYDDLHEKYEFNVARSVKEVEE